jgi:predicted lipid-binding transport protein (Tim44 family)
MFRFRQLLALITMASVLSFAVIDSADARIGRGFSSGSRGARSFSAPSATPTAPNSAAPLERSMAQSTRPSVAPSGGGFFGRPGFFGGGFFGGMLTGFLGAGLIGMLFGHGLFGGLGGFASILGLLLQVALVVLVARFAWAWWQRRHAPAYAGPMARLAEISPYGAQHGSGFGATAPSATQQSPISIGKDDFDTFEQRLGEIQSAYAREDLAALRGYVTPEMLSYFGEDLSKNASRGVVNHVSDVKLLQGDLAEAWREGDIEYATLAMRFSLVDVTVERSSGKVVEGDEHPTEATELWTFMRSRGGVWLLSAIQQAR